MGQHVLVPLDGSTQSEKALQFVREQVPDAQITLLHVIDPVSVLAFADEDDFDFEAYSQEERRRRENAQHMLEEHAETARDRGVTAETVVKTGRPAKRILEAVDDHGIDQIVMGSHGRTGVGRVLFGSIAETVTRRSPVPVTVVR